MCGGWQSGHLSPRTTIIAQEMFTTKRDKAMGELEDERAVGARAHTRQVQARVQQITPTHGSGGKAAWKDKFVSASDFV